MTKVWEENWAADGERVELCEEQAPYGPVAVRSIATFRCFAPEDCTEVDRTKLAAAAPDMARLLLLVECTNEGECPFCQAYLSIDMVDGAKIGQHRSDCRWLVTMQKAGVLE